MIRLRILWVTGILVGMSGCAGVNHPTGSRTLFRPFAPRPAVPAHVPADPFPPPKSASGLDLSRYFPGLYRRFETQTPPTTTVSPKVELGEPQGLAERPGTVVTDRADVSETSGAGSGSNRWPRSIGPRLPVSIVAEVDPALLADRNERDGAPSRTQAEARPESPRDAATRLAQADPAEAEAEAKTQAEPVPNPTVGAVDVEAPPDPFANLDLPPVESVLEPVSSRPVERLAAVPTVPDEREPSRSSRAGGPPSTAPPSGRTLAGRPRMPLVRPWKDGSTDGLPPVSFPDAYYGPDSLPRPSAPPEVVEAMRQRQGFHLRRPRLLQRWRDWRNQSHAIEDEVGDVMQTGLMSDERGSIRVEPDNITQGR